MKAEGRVFKYGDNVDTDVIIPARYLNSSLRRSPETKKPVSPQASGGRTTQPSRVSCCAKCGA